MAKLTTDKNIINIIEILGKTPNLSADQVHRVFTANPAPSGDVYRKSQILKVYLSLEANSEVTLTPTQKNNFLTNVRMKKMRTLSGVTTVTVLTMPFPCPGKCIFCPNDVRMPKSYISSEPGAQRAFDNKFDPYLQTFNRLTALKNIGHPTSKVELIVLGGTWTSYPLAYRIWFIKRCFDAMNSFTATFDGEFKSPDGKEMPFSAEKIDGKGTYNAQITRALKNFKNLSATWDELDAAHTLNVKSDVKCVGLVLETRPDEINIEEVARLRRFGATKVQTGVQSLNDIVLKQNKRGHSSKQTIEAFRLLRMAGFKIHIHYMPNLLGATPKSDIRDFKKLFTSTYYRPDEVKIYPCSLIENTELYQKYLEGKWKPYTYEELIFVLSEFMKKIPNYCRVTRMIRDIPSQEIVAGNKTTNLRQDVEKFLHKTGFTLQEIRSREIRDQVIGDTALKLKITKYKTSVSTEYFLEYVTSTNLIVGFLRLSLPTVENKFKDLASSSIIREVHVYGQSLDFTKQSSDAVQHFGLGKKLINEAIKISKKRSSSRPTLKSVAVISAIGTRDYYKRLGFVLKGMYQFLSF